MKLSCDVIKDLLLLYENGEASEGTRKLVEEHLAHCPSCRELSKPAEVENVKEVILTESAKAEVKAVKNGLGKIRRQWKLSLVSVLMIVPILLIGFLTVNQCRGEGIAFSNIDDIQMAKKFMHFIEEEKFEEAAAMLDYSVDYRSIVAAITNDKQPALIALYGADPTLEEYKAARTENLLAYLEDFKESGYSISDIGFNYVYASDHVYGPKEDFKGKWQVLIRFVEHGPDGFKQNVIAEFMCWDGKISYEYAMEDVRLSAFEYAMNYNSFWHLEKTPGYEEYLEMEKSIRVFEE